MTRIPSYFGDIPAEDVEKITDKYSDLTHITSDMQKRPIEDNAEIKNGYSKGPRLKSYTYTIIKR